MKPTDPAILVWIKGTPKKYYSHADSLHRIFTRPLGTLAQLDAYLADSNDLLVNWLTDEQKQLENPVVIIPTTLAIDVCGWREFNNDLL